MEIPLLPVLMAFCIGLLASDACPPMEWPAIPMALLFALAILALLARSRPAGTAAVLALFLALGYLGGPPLDPHRQIELARLDSEQSGVFEGTVLNRVLASGGRSKVELEVARRCEPGAESGGETGRASSERCLPATGVLELSMAGLPREGAYLRFQSRLSRLESSGNPDQSDPRVAARRNGIDRRGFVADEAWTPYYRAGAPPALPARALARLSAMREDVRASLRGFYRDAPDPATAGILQGLALGERADLPLELKACFARAGLAHLLAISGSHFAVVALGVERLLVAMLLLVPWFKKRWSAPALGALGAVVPLGSYALLVGLTPSIGRALMMGSTVLVLRAGSRKVASRAVLVLAALVILVIDPSALWDVACQLSFASVLALITLAPRFQRAALEYIERLRLEEHGSSLALRLHQALGHLAGLMTTSAAATFGTAPLCAWYFQSIPFIGIIANIAAVPLLGAFSLPLLLCAGLLHLLELPGAVPLRNLAARVVTLGIDVATFFGDPQRFPPFSLELSLPRAILLGLLVASLLLRGRRRLAAAAMCAMMLALTTHLELTADTFSGLLVAQLNVGQGDCTVITLPDGKVVVIDAGGAPPGQSNSFDPGRQVVLPYLQARGHDRIDLMILTHPHPDHMGGLASLAQRLPIGQVWLGERPSRAGAFQDLVEDLEARRVPIVTIDADTRLPTIAGVRFRCLHPHPGWQEETTRKGARSVNNGSVVLELSYGEIDMLFTGDIEREVEAQLVAAGRLEQVEVVKVPHHGSDTSSTGGFVNATRPALVLMGVGRENRFGFPRREVLRRWATRGAGVYRTDQDGTIELRIDGRTIAARTYGRLENQERLFPAWDRREAALP